MRKIFTFLFFFIAIYSYADFPSKDNPLVVILLGPPGAGKGTHALPLSKELGIPHISSGDLFRENLRNNTELGKKVKKFIDDGKLVPDELVVDLVLARISKADCQKGYILDGFPRKLSQAKILDSKINSNAKIIALNFAVPDALLVERITNRLMCQDCSAPFHKKYSPPKKDNTCDHCGGKLYTRSDDTAEIVKKRLKEYHETCGPVADFYDLKNQLYDVNSEKTKREVFEEVRQTVQGFITQINEQQKKVLINN